MSDLSDSGSNQCGMGLQTGNGDMNFFVCRLECKELVMRVRLLYNLLLYANNKVFKQSKGVACLSAAPPAVRINNGGGHGRGEGGVEMFWQADAVSDGALAVVEAEPDSGKFSNHQLMLLRQEDGVIRAQFVYATWNFSTVVALLFGIEGLFSLHQTRWTKLDGPDYPSALCQGLVLKLIVIASTLPYNDVFCHSDVENVGLPVAYFGLLNKA
ncbi:hypothetical protein QYE76_031030 [Lolium multiflorum]|uniref:Uncharacterized protein n=1 Tax=Lolium multiflorum TaxID=4521 RepID=A0AAD8QRE8_LOLMU|nr:hypothetical protein QYE76_031030 [Lolium multiflorum]